MRKSPPRGALAGAATRLAYTYIVNFLKVDFFRERGSYSKNSFPKTLFKQVSQPRRHVSVEFPDASIVFCYEREKSDPYKFDVNKHTNFQYEKLHRGLDFQ